jgi:hypothetical protein
MAKVRITPKISPAPISRPDLTEKDQTSGSGNWLAIVKQTITAATWSEGTSELTVGTGKVTLLSVGGDDKPQEFGGEVDCYNYSQDEVEAGEQAFVFVEESQADGKLYVVQGGGGADDPCWPTDNIYVRRYECDPNPYYVPASPGEETDCCDHDNAAGYLQEYLDYYRWDQALCNWVFEEATTANRVIGCCDPECKTHSVVPPGGNPPGCDACPENPGMFALAAKLTSMNEQYDILLEYDADAQVWIGQIDHLFTDDIGVGQVNVQAQLFVDCWQGPSFGAPNNTQGLPVALACNWADRDNPIVEDYNEVQPGVPYKGKLTMQTDALAINTQCGGVIPQNNTTIGVEILIGDCQW